MAGELDPMIANDGGLVYTALVKPQLDGTLMVCVLIDDDEDHANRRVWLSKTFNCIEASSLSADLMLLGPASCEETS